MFLRQSKPLFVALIVLTMRTVAGESHGPFREVSSVELQWRPNEAPATGNDFMVTVNDRTKHSEYTHGY